MVGSALLRQLKRSGYTNIITRTHRELDLTNSGRVMSFFKKERPDYVFLAAAKVGGINANISYPAELIHENIAIQTSVIDASAATDVVKLVNFSSSCVYPEKCFQPMREGDLLSGPLEPNIEPSAISKIAGMKLCQAYNNQYGTCFISVIPPTMYGPRDNFDLLSSHVLSALLAKFHKAKIMGYPSVEIWGTGTPLREFLHVDDVAEACMYLVKLEKKELIASVCDCGWALNIGSSRDMTILDLAQMIKEIVGYTGDMVTDTTRPDGAAKKLLDSTWIKKLGWAPKIKLYDGIKQTY